MTAGNRKRTENDPSDDYFAMMRLGDWDSKQRGLKRPRTQYDDPEAFPAYLDFLDRLWQATLKRFPAPASGPSPAFEAFRAARPWFRDFQRNRSYERSKAREGRAPREEE